MTTDALAVRWWLDERQLDVACLVVKMAVICRDVGSSSQIEDSQEA